MRTGVYVYKGEKPSQEELYLKKCLESFVKDVGHPRGITSQYEFDQKHFIDARLMMDVCTREKRKIIFGKS